MAKSPTDSQWLWISAFAGHLGKMSESEQKQEIQKYRTEHYGDNHLLDIAINYLNQQPAIDRDRSGETIDSYKLMKPLGHGGMGEVYLAEEFLNGNFIRNVALKLIRWPLALSKDEKLRKIDRFEEEVQKLAKIESEHIVTLYKAGTYTEDATVEKFPYLVMRHVKQARSLIDYVEQAKLNPIEKLKLFAKVCDGVKQLHSIDLIHCDLKPANILVDSDGNPRVADFGLVKLLGVFSERGPFGMAEGSPAYMSPEQVSNNFGNITKKTDVYALGLILFEMLTGKLPYDIPKFELDAGVWEKQLVLVITQSTPEELPKKMSVNLRGLNELIKKTLAKSPADRLSFDTFANEINRIVALDRAKHLMHRVGWIAIVLLTLIGINGVFGQIRTVKSLVSIDTRLVEMIDSDLLAEIAQKSETEPGVIRQTLTQFKNQTVKKDVLAFADELIKEDRHEDAYALLRFVSETIFQSKNPNYLLASKVFSKVSDCLKKQADVSEDQQIKSKIYTLQLGVLARGINSFSALPFELKKTEKETERLLLIKYADSTFNCSAFIDPLEKKRLFEKAISLFNKFKAIDSCSDDGKVDFFLKKSALMLSLADFHEATLEVKLIDDSIAQVVTACEIASKIKDSVSQYACVRSFVRSSLRKTKTVSGKKRRELLEQIVAKCDQVPVLTSEESHKYEIEIKIRKAEALLELSQEPITEFEENQRVKAAARILKAISGDVRKLKDAWPSSLFMEEWLLCNFYGLNEIENYHVAFEKYAQVGYSSKVRHAKVLYGFLGSLDGFQSTFEEFDPVVNVISGYIKEYTPDSAPRISSELLQQLFKIYWWRSNISRFRIEDIEKYGSKKSDEMSSKVTNDRLRSFFKKEYYPYVWLHAEANDIRFDKRYGFSSEEAIKAIERILELNKLVNKNDDPIVWADIQLLLADIYESNDSQIDKSVQIRESVLEIYSQKDHPKKYAKIKQEITDLKSKKILSK